jgi:phage baseplate assembly protein W
MIVNEEVINQSIEMILATPIASRLFNLNFGSNFAYRVFDNMGPEYLQTVMEDTVERIKQWEDRIIIIERNVVLTVSPNNNSVKLVIPYIIKQRNIKGEFSKIVKQ